MSNIIIIGYDYLQFYIGVELLSEVPNKVKVMNQLVENYILHQYRMNMFEKETQLIFENHGAMLDDEVKEQYLVEVSIYVYQILERIYIQAYQNTKSYEILKILLDEYSLIYERLSLFGII